jgi:ADP-ribosylglycohydrolase
MHLIDANPLVIETALIWVKALHLLFLKGDHEEAFYLISKSIYDSGSEELQNLWQIVEKGSIIPSKGNLGRLKTSFTYAFIELNQPTLNFTDTLIEVLRKGGDTDSNAAIVCSLIGAAVGYSSIPSYFRHKI